MRTRVRSIVPPGVAATLIWVKREASRKGRPQDGRIRARLCSTRQKGVDAGSARPIPLSPKVRAARTDLSSPTCGSRKGNTCGELGARKIFYCGTRKKRHIQFAYMHPVCRFWFCRAAPCCGSGASGAPSWRRLVGPTEPDPAAGFLVSVASWRGRPGEVAASSNLKNCR